jgi:hypothetical protein
VEYYCRWRSLRLCKERGGYTLTPCINEQGYHIPHGSHTVLGRLHFIRQHYIEKENKSRLNSGNACYHEVVSFSLYLLY